MKTKLRNIAMTIGLTAVLGSATLIAEVANKSIANIPFDFQVKKTTLPAGPYAVGYSQDSKLLVFRNLANGKSSIVLAHQFKSGTTIDPKVVFRYDGERYTMEEVWFAGQGMYGPLKGKHERENSERGVAATVRMVTK
jgi:hypothetical protein